MSIPLNSILQRREAGIVFQDVTNVPVHNVCHGSPASNSDGPSPGLNFCIRNDL